jgi:hypothetical protein
MKHNIEIVNGSIEYFLMRVNNLLAIQQQEEDVDGEWIVTSLIFLSRAIGM